MSNMVGFRFSPEDLRPVLVQLEGTLAALQELRRQLGLEEAPGEAPPLARAIHDAFVDYSLSWLSRFQEITLRPISERGEWVDMPTGRTLQFAAAERRSDPRNWLEAFPDFEEEVTNIIGNETYLVIERRAAGTHDAPLRCEDYVVEPTGERFEIQAADVITFENGEIIRNENYYDMASVLRRLGQMPDIPLGHDERDATPLPVLHASGFLRLEPEVRLREDGPYREPDGHGRSISISSSRSKQARVNRDNCVAIHEAFIEHTPERFGELIAENAVWIDVPTGEVLNGAVAAAHHDHGNWQTAFPDSSAEVTNMVTNDDWVVVQHRGYGTHLGPLRLGGREYRPTGRKVEIRVLDVVQYEKGMAVLIRNYYDMGMMLIQLGILPG